MWPTAWLGVTCTTSSLFPQLVVAEHSPGCLEGPAWLPWERPRLLKHPRTSRGLNSMISSWEAADLKAISECVLSKKMFAGRVCSCAYIFPKGPYPWGVRIFLFFPRISLKNVSPSSSFSHLFLHPVPHWDVSQFHRAACSFLWKPLVLISSPSLDLKEVGKSLSFTNTFQAHEKWARSELIRYLQHQCTRRLGNRKKRRADWLLLYMICQQLLWSARKMLTLLNRNDIRDGLISLLSFELPVQIQRVK